MFGLDSPAHDDWLAHPAGLGEVPEKEHGTEVAQPHVEQVYNDGQGCLRLP